MNNHRPIILGYTQPGQTFGHAILICGYGHTGWVYMIDPDHKHIFEITATSGK